MSLDSSQDILNLGTFAVGWHSDASTVYTHPISRIAYTVRNIVFAFCFSFVFCVVTNLASEQRNINAKLTWLCRTLEKKKE